SAITLCGRQLTSRRGGIRVRAARAQQHEHSDRARQCKEQRLARAILLLHRTFLFAIEHTHNTFITTTPIRNLLLVSRFANRLRRTRWLPVVPGLKVTNSYGL